jgi:hypothetical protein
MAATRAAQDIERISDDRIVAPESEAYDKIMKSYFSEVEHELSLHISLRHGLLSKSHKY